MRIENPIGQKLTQIEFYSDIYSRHKSDSPDLSRTSLLRRAHFCMSMLSAGKLVLELGSGSQIVTYQYLRDRNLHPPYTIVTLDIAQIAKRKLLARNAKIVTHIRAEYISLKLTVISPFLKLLV